MSEQGSGAVSRRRVVQGLAWATPAIVIATSAPAAAGSPAGGTAPVCDSALDNTPVVLARGSWAVASGGPLRQADTRRLRETGWTPSVSGDTTTENSGYPMGGSANGQVRPGFQSMDDHTLVSTSANPQAAWTVVTAEYSFTATPKTRYSIAFESRTQHGNHNANQSARQSAVLTANGTELVKFTVRHGSNATLPPGNRTDGQMTALGYSRQAASTDAARTFQSRTATYDTADGGVVVLRFTFTIEGIHGNSNGVVADDIWVSTPVVTQVGCI